MVEDEDIVLEWVVEVWMDKTLTIDGICLVLNNTSGMHATSFDRRTMKKGFLAIHV